MIKKYVKCVVLTAAVTLAAAFMTGCGGNEIDGKATVAVINDEKIPMGVANLMARFQQAQMFSTYASYFGTTGMFDTVSDEETGETYGDTVKEEILEQLKDMYLLRQHAADYEVEITDEESAAITDAAEAFMTDNDEETITKLAVTQEDVETLLELYTYQTKMREAMIADVDQEVSDEEAAQTRVSFVQISLAGTGTDEEGNTIELTEEEKAAKEAQAQEILSQIQASEDVAAADMNAIAQGVDENLSNSSRTYGSDDEDLDSAVKEAVEGLADGQVVDHVVTASDGSALYVIRLDAAFDQDATETEKESIISQRETEDYDNEIEEWSEASSYSVKKGQWKKVLIDDTDVYAIKSESTEENVVEEGVVGEDASGENTADESAAEDDAADQIAE